MNIAPLTGLNVNAASQAGELPRNLQQAAESFEALFLGNLLKSARDARDGAALGESDQASGSMMDMAEEFLAQEIAKGGGCGMASMVMKQMEQRATVSAPASESPVK